MDAPTTIPSTSTLESWTNDPESARENLCSLLLCLAADESMADLATEALENCGVPSESDQEFLVQAVSNPKGDVAYWACKLIGRLGLKANDSQAALCTAMLAEDKSFGVRQQAALALGLIGSLNEASRQALRMSAQSNDSRLSRLASQSLGNAS